MTHGMEIYNLLPPNRGSCQNFETIIFVKGNVYFYNFQES